MLLPDPINNPGAPGFSSCELVSVSPVFQDWMPNTKSLSVSSGEHYWEVSLGYSDMLPSEYNILQQSIDKALQLGEKLEIWLPQYEDYTFKLSNYAVQQSTNTSITLSQAGMVSTAKRGMLLQFSNHKKVYRITDFRLSGGNVIIDFYPSLRTAVTTANTVKFTSIRFSMDFKDRSTPLPQTLFNSDGFYSEGITLELREAT